MTAPAPDVQRAWQAALAAEHQAAFGYPLLGPQLSGADRELARRCQDEHESLRNATSARLAAAGLDPVAPLGDYPALYPVVGVRAARALAVRLEDECATAWRYLYAAAAALAADQPRGRCARRHRRRSPRRPCARCAGAAPRRLPRHP